MASQPPAAGLGEIPADVQCARRSSPRMHHPTHTCDKIRLMSADVTGRTEPALGFRPPRDIGRVSTCWALVAQGADRATIAAEYGDRIVAEGAHRIQVRDLVDVSGWQRANTLPQIVPATSAR